MQDSGDKGATGFTIYDLKGGNRGFNAETQRRKDDEMARERTELRTKFTKRAESDPPVFLPMQSLCSFVGCGAGVSPPHCLNNRSAKPIRVAELIASDSEVAYFSCANEK